MGEFTEQLLSGISADKEMPEPSFSDEALSGSMSAQKSPEASAVTFGYFKQAQELSRAKTIKIGQGMMTLGNGMMQASMDTLELLGILEPGTTNEFTKLRSDEKRLVDKAFKEEFGDSFGFDIAEGAGEIIPLFAIPASGAKTGIGRVAQAAGVGGGIGATSFIAEGDPASRMAERAKGFATGAVTAAGLSTAMETIPLIRNFFKRTFFGDAAENRHIITEDALIAANGKPVKVPEDIRQQILSKQRAQAFIERGEKVSEATGIKFKLSQLSPDPGTESLEAFARASMRGERIARKVEDSQIIGTLKYFTKTAKAISPDKADFGERITRTFFDTLGDSAKGTGLLGRRASQAKINFGAARNEVTAIPLKKVVNELDDMIARYSDVGQGDASKLLAKKLLTLKKELSEGTVNPTQMQNLLETWGAASRGTGKIFTDIDRAAEMAPARRLFAALNRDLDDAVDSNTGAKLLKKARDEFREASLAIDMLEESALGKIFGRKAQPSLEKIEDAFTRMRPTEIKAAMDILGKTDTNIQRGLQRFWLERALNKAKVPTSGESLQFMPGMILDINKGANRDIYKAVFNDAESRKRVAIGLEAVRRIMINNAKSNGTAIPRIKEIAGVLASRDPTFTARLAAELFAPRTISKLALDAEGIKALIQLSKPFNQNAYSAALVKINDIVFRDDPGVIDAAKKPVGVTEQPVGGF